MLTLLQRHFRKLRRRGIAVSAITAAAAFALTLFWLTSVVPNRERFTLYFSSNVHGLSAGAPVVMSGQTIGQVDDIRVCAVPAGNARKYYAAVTITLDGHRLRERGLLQEEETLRDALPSLIGAGLRGKLLMPSLLANGLCVSLYFSPGEPASRAAPPNADFPEIPTNYTSSSEFVDRANAFIETRNLYEAARKIRDLAAVADAFEAAAQTFDGEKTNAEILRALERANAALSPDAARRELESLNDALAAICDGLESDARIPAEQAQRAAASLKKMTEMLRELRGSARAIQEQISPENLEIRRRMLREMQNQYAPLIDAAKGLFL